MSRRMTSGCSSRALRYAVEAAAGLNDVDGAAGAETHRRNEADIGVIVDDQHLHDGVS